MYGLVFDGIKISSEHKGAFSCGFHWREFRYKKNGAPGEGAPNYEKKLLLFYFTLFSLYELYTCS